MEALATRFTCQSLTRLALIGIVLLATAGASAARADDRSVVVEWNEALLAAITHTGSGPTVASRALAVAHTCIYEAWAVYEQRARSTQPGASIKPPRSGPSGKDQAQAVSYAAYHAALHLFPGEKTLFTPVLTRQGLAPDNDDGSPMGPAGIGTRACQAVLESRDEDGANQHGRDGGEPYSDYTGYTPVNSPDYVADPNHWQPLRLYSSDGGVIEQSFMTAHWGDVDTFLSRPPRSFHVKEPAPYGSSEYREQVLEVVSYSANLTEAQKMSAEYWADGPNTVTPPGHWNLFAQAVSKRDAHDLAQDVKMYFALNNALMDAGIVCWWVKREYDYVRPITAVRVELGREMIEAWGGVGMGTQRIPGEQWTPYQKASELSPPFPEYVSGHSTFSAAAAEVLKRFTGSDVFGHQVTLYAGSSYVEPRLVPAHDLTLSWATFTDAANDAAMSRRYGGIHFLDGDMEGRRLGREIGAQVWDKASRYFANTD